LPICTIDVYYGLVGSTVATEVVMIIVGLYGYIASIAVYPFITVPKFACRFTVASDKIGELVFSNLQLQIYSMRKCIAIGVVILGIAILVGKGGATPLE
jgi:hypothetical protein